MDRTPVRTLARAMALLLATAAAAFVILVPGAARACACGGAYPPEGTELAAGDETVFLSRTADGRERMEMALELTGDTTDVAVVIPTPAVPEVEQGSAGRLAELDELSTPPPEPQEHDGDGDGAAAPPTGGAPEVVDEVVLDDVVATVLRGGTADGVVAWLDDNGYTQKPAVEPVIADYLADDWIFTAVKLRTDRPVSGAVDPIVLTFDRDELVYPMRMSSVAEDPGSVTAYVLAEEFVDLRVEGGQSSELVHTTRLEADDVEDALLAELVDGGDAALTRWHVDVSDPDALSDFGFVPDAEIEAADEEEQGDGALIAVLSAVIAVLALAFGIAVVAALRRRS